MNSAQPYHLPETHDLQSGTRDFERGVFSKCLQLNISNLFNCLLKITLNAHISSNADHSGEHVNEYAATCQKDLGTFGILPSEKLL